MRKRRNTLIDIQLHRDQHKAVITVDGKLFTEYCYGQRGEFQSVVCH